VDAVPFKVMKKKILSKPILSGCPRGFLFEHLAICAE
jgi:hypothetical protein